MVTVCHMMTRERSDLSVLALSSRFDGPPVLVWPAPYQQLSVLALSSRFDGQRIRSRVSASYTSFSTRSVESF